MSRLSHYGGRATLAGMNGSKLVVIMVVAATALVVIFQGINQLS